MAKKKIFTILKQVFGLNQDLNAKKQQKKNNKGGNVAESGTQSIYNIHSRRIENRKSYVTI